MTSHLASRGDPDAPAWWAAIALRVITLAFAVGVVAVHRAEYARPWLAWTVLAAMALWTVLTTLAYARQRSRWHWLVVLDLVLTCGFMLSSRWVLSEEMYAEAAPLITTVWVSGAVVAAAVRFGPVGGVLGAVLIAAGTGLARLAIDLDVVRDGVLLVASGLIVGLAVRTQRRAAVLLERALRTEAATAERERLARSIHDSVLQVLARVRKRGAEIGGEAAELAALAGEQEVSLRALVASGPVSTGDSEDADLRARLQLLATPRVAVATPAGEVRLPAQVVAELHAVVVEALCNVARHAGADARAWVLLEDLGNEVVVSVRDDGPGIADGRLERAVSEGRLGVTQAIKGRVAALGGTITLDTARGVGTEWELRVPRGKQSRNGG